MIRIAAYLAVNVEIESGPDSRRWSLPLANLAPLLAVWLTLAGWLAAGRQRLQQAGRQAAAGLGRTADQIAAGVEALTVACKVACIGFNAFKFALV